MEFNFTKNEQVKSWLQSRIDLVNPDKVVYIDGSEELYKKLTDEAIASGEMIKLNEKTLPGCLLHRTKPNDVARVEARTFICCKNEEDAGRMYNWCDPTEMHAKLDAILKDSYKGKTMYIIPYSMGPVGGPISKIGLEVTDSIYVVLNMRIMTRVGQNVMDALGNSSDFVKGTHASCDVDPENRYICQFPEENAIVSVNSAYGGNVLQGKKCFALRIASYQGKNEGWMAEHMLILGIKRPGKETVYMCAAFPSACGKTNLAMLIPPKSFQEKGYEVFTVGDDIAWIKPGADGRLYAINPENGFFGVAPGTNSKSNYNALMSTKKNAIFTNVAWNPKTNEVWWEALEKDDPEKKKPDFLIDWTGKDWTPDTVDAEGKPVKAAHPNSRFTAPAENCPCISPAFKTGEPVPVSAFIFGGRRPTTVPLVYQAKSWDNGVFIGSIMGSETTAAATGAVGVVRRDPMAMRPFFGYHVADYFQHWLDMGKIVPVDKQPKIFNVNWFRTDDEGNFVWPGFGDNMRVLDWMLKRIDGEVDAVETPIGYLPKPEDIDISDIKNFSEDTLKSILTVDKDAWKKEAEGIKEFYATLGPKMPKELLEQADALLAKFSK